MTRPRLSAADELAVFKRSIRLLPGLARRGITATDALAVAYNAAFLYMTLRKKLLLVSPRQILKRYTLLEIANLCEEYFTQGLAEPESTADPRRRLWRRTPPAEGGRRGNALRAFPADRLREDDGRAAL